MLTSSITDNLRCTFCHNTLSVFPVYTYGNKDTVSCGRCPVKEEFLPQRELLYEEIAQYIEFPCQNQDRGCIERLKPNELQEHEKYCLHKPYLCPALPNCVHQWKGDCNELFHHYEECHTNLTHESFCAQISLVHSYEENHVLGHNGETFVVQLKCDKREQTFYCNVKYCGLPSESKKFLYRAYFMSKKKKFGWRVCTVQSSEVDWVINENTSSININDIMTKLDCPIYVICMIDIFIKKTVVQTEEVVPPEDNEMLKIIECPICLDYMEPPIIQCVQGHSFCQDCRSKLTQCPTCKGSINETRNFSLENITQMLEYPCKYSKFGCKHTANLNNKKRHETSCEKKPWQCVVSDCRWQGKNIELQSHLKEVHQDNIIEDNFITYILDENYDTQLYFIILHNEIFPIEFERTENLFQWRLRLHNKINSNKYIFELDFGCRTENRLYVSKKIDTATEELIIMLDIQQLEIFFQDDLLPYKIRIIETY